MVVLSTLKLPLSNSSWAFEVVWYGYDRVSLLVYLLDGFLVFVADFTVTLEEVSFGLESRLRIHESSYIACCMDTHVFVASVLTVACFSPCSVHCCN